MSLRRSESMARIKVAVVPVDAVGHLNPLLAVVAALADRDDVAEVRAIGPPRLAEAFTGCGARYVGADAGRLVGDAPDASSELARARFVRPLATIEKHVRCLAAF